jgi:lipid A 3-O-deacylase
MKLRFALLAFPVVVMATLPGRLAGADAAPSAVAIERLAWGSLSLYSENDKYFAGTDRRYTNGLKISGLTANLRSFESPHLPGPVRWLAQRLSRFVQRDEVPKVGLSLGQNIYTPENTETTAPQPGDRPYAAWLYTGVSFHNYRPSINAYGDRRIPRLDILEINLGVVGPWALGRQIQNGFHDLIGVEHAEGWDNQLKNEPGLNLIFERKWRFRTGDLESDWALEVIPHVGFCLGNVNTQANAGLEVRAGFRLPVDFGTSLIRPTGDSNPLLPVLVQCLRFCRRRRAGRCPRHHPRWQHLPRRTLHLTRKLGDRYRLRVRFRRATLASGLYASLPDQGVRIAAGRSGVRLAQHERVLLNP